MDVSDKKVVQKIVLGAVIFNQDKALILQRNSNETVFPNMWELPSGKRESLESSFETLKREVLEESGLNVEPVMPVSVFDYTVEKPDEIRDSTQINFIVSVIGDNNVKLSQEHQNFCWVTETELENYEISDETKKVILEAFRLYKLINSIQ